MSSSSTRPPSPEVSGPVFEVPHVPEVFADTSGLTRGQLLHRGLAAGLAVGATGVLPDAALGATQPTKAPRLRDALANPTAIHPFRVSFPNAQLVALHHHVAATRWPSMELVTDHSQGVQLATARRSPTSGRLDTTGAHARRG